MSSTSRSAFSLRLPEVDDLDVPLALVADIDAVPLVLFDREIGEGLLLLVAAEGAFDPPIAPLEAALVAEKVTGSLIVPDLADLGFPAADGAVALRPVRLPDGVAVARHDLLQGRSQALFDEELHEIEGVLLFLFRERLFFQRAGG